MKHPRKKSWGKMSAAELAAATREFDRPLPASRFKPAGKTERERFEKARRAGLDKNLLRKARAYAKKRRLTLTQLIERGLRRELAVAD